jgi:predicted PurR-regulated permease PerM
MGERRTPRIEDLTRHTGGEPSVAWWRAAAINGGGIALAVGLLVLIWLLAWPLTLLLIAIIIAQALMPVVGWLERWLPRPLATIAIYLTLVTALAGLGWIILPALIDQGQLLVRDAPEVIAQTREWMRSMDPAGVDRVVAALESQVRRLGDVLLSAPVTIFSSVINIVLVVFMSAYWVLAAPALHRFALSLFPEERRSRVDDVMRAMGDTMGGFVRGTVIDSAIVGILTWIGLSLIGVEYPLLLAAIQGFGELIPMVGPIIAAIPAIAVALLESPQQAIVVVIFFVVLQQVESNLLVPVIMRQQADVPPLLSLVAIPVGSVLGGLVGALVAIPLLGAARVLVVRVMAPAEREWTGVDDAPTEIGADPEAEPSGDPPTQ